MYVRHLQSSSSLRYARGVLLAPTAHCPSVLILLVSPSRIDLSLFFHAETRLVFVEPSAMTILFSVVGCVDRDGFAVCPLARLLRACSVFRAPSTCLHRAKVRVKACLRVWLTIASFVPRTAWSRRGRSIVYFTASIRLPSELLDRHAGRYFFVSLLCSQTDLTRIVLFCSLMMATTIFSTTTPP